MASNTYNSTLATDPLRTFRFNAKFTSSDGTANAAIQTGTNGFTMGFTTISGLSITTQNIEYREGGMNTTVHQVPGLTTFQPVVFSRGALAGNDQAITWMRSLFAAASGAGVAVSGTSGFRVDVVVTVNAHPNAGVDISTPQMAFKIHNAWITNLSYSDLDAQNGAIFFERMTLIHEGISAVIAGPKSATDPTTTPAPGTSGLTVAITL
jgi:phage tail-like protein